MRGGVAPVAALLVVLPLACTTPSNVQPYVTPAPSTVAVTITTRPPPRDDGTVPRNARFLVQLDGYPDPDSVGFGPITVRSGRANFDIETEVDLVGQQVVVTPRSLLAPATQYDVVVSGLVTLDDRVQAAEVSASFRAGLDDGDPIAPPQRPTWTAVRRLFVETYVCTKYCHGTLGASESMRTPTRLLNLDLDDPTDPIFGLVDVVSVGLRGTNVPLKRVSPGDPARSVLLRKLLGGSRTADSLDPPYPSMRVDGRRMPIPLDESKPAVITLSDDDLKTVQAWIAAGAPTN